METPGLDPYGILPASALEINQKIQFNHIPFEGAAPAVTALMGKHIEAVTVNSGEVKAGVDAGKLKILAIMTPQRDPAFPKVPTLIESGIKLDFVGWGGFAVAKGTPKPILAVLSSALKKAASSDEFKTFITSRGMIVNYRDSDDFKQFVASQYVFFSDPALENGAWKIIVQAKCLDEDRTIFQLQKPVCRISYAV